MNHDVQAYWKGRARRIRRRLNAGWWVAAYLPVLAACGLTLAVLLVWWRVEDFAPWSLGAIAAAVLAVGSAVTFVYARRRFHTEDDAIVWLDLEERLGGRLLTAHEGAGPWPPRPTTPRARLDWRWSRVLSPIAGIAVVTAVAAWMPISIQPKAPDDPVAEPVVWENVETAIEILEEEELADEELLEDWKDRLDALKKQAPETWFEHGNLEASDHLWEGVQDSVARMEKDVTAVEKALEGTGDATSDDERKRFESALSEALEQLASKESSLSDKMKKALGDIQPSQVPSMSEKERRQLERRLAMGREALRRARRAAEGDGKEGPGGEDGEVKRGPGHAPLLMTGDAKRRDTGREEGLEGIDPDRAALGDVVKIDATSHDVDPNAFRRTTGGGTKALGEGGDAVYRTSFMPNEQAVLEKYFQ